MENKKSYYAIIPANVRYDKDLTPNAKLLYGEITALCNEKGYCWARNEYFAELYGVSKQSISSWVSQLALKRYINTSIEYREGSKEILNRYIRISEYPIQENLNTPIQENLKDNNTLNNTTSNNTFNIYNEFFEKVWSKYPLKKGKGSIKDSQKKKLYKLGEEVINKCIDRYVSEMKGKEEFYKHGSTFFNSGYIDYLDENYQPMGGKKNGGSTEYNYKIDESISGLTEEQKQRAKELGISMQEL